MEKDGSAIVVLYFPVVPPRASDQENRFPGTGWTDWNTQPPEPTCGMGRDIGGLPPKIKQPQRVKPGFPPAPGECTLPLGTKALGNPLKGQRKRPI